MLSLYVLISIIFISTCWSFKSLIITKRSLLVHFNLDFKTSLGRNHRINSFVRNNRKGICSINNEDVQRITEYSNDVDTVPRLYPDIEALIAWIEVNSGLFNSLIWQSKEGWSLVASHFVKKGETILRIPKKLCIYSDPNQMIEPLSPNTKALMESLDANLWRARLAIALLSERVKKNSYFGPYIQNLPFEFWGCNNYCFYTIQY